jgi:ubiquitin conjugation factor E4 B
VWQDKTLRQILHVTLNPDEAASSKDLIYLASTREDLTGQDGALQLNTEMLDGVITEAAGQAPGGKPFEYLLTSFKRVSRSIRHTKYSGPEDPRHELLAETRRLIMSYAIFAVTMPETFGDHVPMTNPLVDHLLAEPECDVGICTDFLTEASNRFDEDETIKDAIVGAAEELSERLASVNMLQDHTGYVRGMRNLLRFPKIVDAVTQSPKWIPEGVEPQDIEKKTLLGPFFRLSPMQLEVAQNYFSAPKTRDRGFIVNAQNAARMTLRTLQADLFQMANTVVRAGQAPRDRILNWFALCLNKNHKRRAMRVDYKSVSSDGFMVNITSVLDQLCEPFMDATFSKIDRIDIDYLRRNPRLDISDETKINADQKAADDFYANKASGTSNFISEVFFLTVAAHHYGTEAAQTRASTLRKSTQRMEKELAQFELERTKFARVRALRLR